MRQEMGFEDEKMNLFKLKLYNWNVNDATKYYQNDIFCHKYCICKNYKYGCANKQCRYQHSISTRDLVFGDAQQRNYKHGELLCLYLMYKKVYNDSNPELFNAYGWILYITGKSQQDFLKSEKYYLKALAIDNNYYAAHNNYASLLLNKLQNYDKAQYHFIQSLKIEPNDAISHANFAKFLIETKHQYEAALSHCKKSM